jgi:PTS system nitrogen regulatory IIA component
MELTLEEVAVRLNIPVETLHRWIRQGKIPMQQTRGRYTIHREMLERWAYDHKLKFFTPPSSEDSADESELDAVLPAMRRGGIFYGIEGDTKEKILKAAVQRIPNLQTFDRHLIYDKLLEREGLASTGIGHGIALPHPRANLGIPLERPLITTCFLSRAIPYEAIDNRPVSVIMVLLSTSTREHLSLLSKVAFYLRDRGFRDHLLSAPPKETIFEFIEQIDAASH